LDVLTRIAELLAEGETFCLATVVEGTEPGRKAVVRRDGTLELGLGSAELDASLKELAAEALRQRKRRLVELTPGVKVFLDVLSAEARLVVCGAGHIALPLARFARELGFAVTVIDDRADFAHPSRFPGCEVIAGEFAETLRGLALGPAAYVVVITRGHEHDADCLAEVLPRETAYVGMIGSQRRGQVVLQELGRQGIPAERLKQIFTPIGLAVGAESPAEIALSIAAELVAVRRLGPRGALALRKEEGRA
jgi:xanthine dehydrogenase accessory factor